MFGMEEALDTGRTVLAFEQLEERIVLDGAIEATATTWTPPTPGTGIFDGEFHRIEDRTFVFLEDALHGLGVGYWWDPTNACWGWALDFETGWWWENRGSGWDWMNCAWWDFEQYANAGICVFDGQHRTDAYGMEFWYDQAGDEMLYRKDGVWQFKYEFDSATDSLWGWHVWSKSTGDWTGFGNAVFNDYIEFNGYSGHSAQCMWTGFWHPLPGGHGKDWTATERNLEVLETGIIAQAFWLDGGLDLQYRHGDGWTAFTGWTVPGTDLVLGRYIGDSLFVFRDLDYYGLYGFTTDGVEWTVYDGSWGAGTEWFRYACYVWDPYSSPWGSADFGPTLKLAFLGNSYQSNEPYLETNVISIMESYTNYKGDGLAGIYEMAEMMLIVSQANASLYFDTVMLHEWGSSFDGFWMGDHIVEASTFSADAGAFRAIGGMMLGETGGDAYFQILNSNAADTAGDRAILAQVYDCLNHNTPYGAEVELWASIDSSGNWDGETGHDPNWNLEWDILWDPGMPYVWYLPWDKMLYQNWVLDGGSTELDGAS